MKVILQKEAPVLREVAEEVPLADISSPRTREIIRQMKEALASQEDGVAIAAPQIGYSLRIFIVSGKVAALLGKEAKNGTHKTDKDGHLLVGEYGADRVFINPVITKLSREKKMTEEGCLSVRYLYGEVNRSTKATVEAYDEHGKKFTLGGSGLLAQIFQHETDHLNGILFIDKAKYLEEVIPAHVAKQQRAKRTEAHGKSINGINS